MTTTWSDELAEGATTFGEPNTSGQGYGMQPYGSPAGSISGYGDPDITTDSTTWTEGL